MLTFGASVLGLFSFSCCLVSEFPRRRFIFASTKQDVVKLRFQTNRSDLILPILCCPRDSETIQKVLDLLTEAIIQKHVKDVFS